MATTQWRPADDDGRFQYSLLDLCAFVGLTAFSQGVLSLLGAGTRALGGPSRLLFHAISLPATLIVVFLGVSWGIKTAREGKVQGAWRCLGLHLLGVGATLGLFGLLATLLLVLVGAFTMVGALIELPFTKDNPAQDLPTLALMLLVTTALSSLLLLAGWMRRRLRRQAGYDPAEDE